VKKIIVIFLLLVFIAAAWFFAKTRNYQPAVPALVTESVSEEANASGPVDKQACEAKDGYWYNDKCWMDFKDMDDGISPDKIDEEVDKQMQLIEQSRVTINGKKYPIKMVEPLENDGKITMIVSFRKDGVLNTLVIRTSMDAGDKKEGKYKSEGMLFDHNLLVEDENANFEPIAYGNMLGNLKSLEDLGFSFEGTLKDKSGKEFEIYLEANDALIGAGMSTLEIRGDNAYLNGDLGAVTYGQVKDLIKNHPEVKTIIFENVPGSVNDSVNMYTGQMIRDAGLTTKVLSDSEIASGGVDLFCAGKERVVTKGAKLGVHSWDNGDKEGREFPKDHPAHQYQIAYFTMCLGEKGKDFYFYTLDAAPADGIHWMTEDEISKWGIATKIVDASGL